MIFIVTETMATGRRMSNGYHLRTRSIPPQLQIPSKVSFPTSLINISDPAKSEILMQHFIRKMKKSEARQVACSLVYFSSLQWLFFLLSHGSFSAYMVVSKAAAEDEIMFCVCFMFIC